MYKEIKGDLFRETETGSFDVIAHQINCFCVQGGGISGQFVKRFNTNNGMFYPGELEKNRGNINKLGNIECNYPTLSYGLLAVVNLYGQYEPGANTDYTALRFCLKKLNHMFKGMRIGLPQIGCGIGGGDWEEVRKIIKEELIDCGLVS